jgi:hypothetical protein
MESPVSTIHTKYSLKNKTSPPTSNFPTLNLKGRKRRHPESMIALPIGWIKFLSSKGFITFFCLGYYPSQRAPRLYRYMGRNLGKTYGFDIRCYWEHPWGTHWKLGEQLGNMVGTHQQLVKKILSPLPPPLKTQIKKLGRLNGCCTFLLATCNFYFQKC